MAQILTFKGYGLKWFSKLVFIVRTREEVYLTT